jgi:hypothetical protein
MQGISSLAGKLLIFTKTFYFTYFHLIVLYLSFILLLHSLLLTLFTSFITVFLFKIQPIIFKNEVYKAVPFLHVTIDIALYFSSVTACLT